MRRFAKRCSLVSLVSRWTGVEPVRHLCLRNGEGSRLKLDARDDGFNFSVCIVDVVHRTRIITWTRRVYMTRLLRTVARKGGDNVPLHLFFVLKIFLSPRTTWVNPEHPSRSSLFAFLYPGGDEGSADSSSAIDCADEQIGYRHTRVDCEIESWTFPLHIVRFSREFP